MSEILLSLVLEFVAPFLEKASQEAYDELISNCSKRRRKKHKPDEKKDIKENLLVKTIREQEVYIDRVISWSFDRIHELLSNEKTHIRELDALLAATGSNDTLAHEELMQSLFLNSVQDMKNMLDSKQTSALQECLNNRFEKLFFYLMDLNDRNCDTKVLESKSTNNPLKYHTTNYKSGSSKFLQKGKDILLNHITRFVHRHERECSLEDTLFSYLYQ